MWCLYASEEVGVEAEAAYEPAVAEEAGTAVELPVTEAADKPTVAEEAGTAVEPPVTEAEAADKPAVAEAEA